MANKVYYKLGELAGVFYDPSLRILIRKNEVIEFDKAPKSKKFNQAKAGGHISMATKDEFDDYQASLRGEVKEPVKEEKANEPEVKEPVKGKLTPEEVALKKTLEGMETNEEIVEHFKLEGFLEEDIEKLTAIIEGKKATIIKLAIELNREYK